MAKKSLPVGNTTVAPSPRSIPAQEDFMGGQWEGKFPGDTGRTWRTIANIDRAVNGLCGVDTILRNDGAARSAQAVIENDDSDNDGLINPSVVWELEIARSFLATYIQAELEELQSHLEKNRDAEGSAHHG